MNWKVLLLIGLVSYGAFNHFNHRPVVHGAGEIAPKDPSQTDTHSADIPLNGFTPVSYTHLDVYKRQSENGMAENHHHDIYNTAFYRAFRKLVTTCVRCRKTVILITVAMFILSVIGFGKVQQQFFPDSTRLELVVDLRLTEGASYNATNNEVKKLELWLQNWRKQYPTTENQGIDNYVAYIGTGSPRYYLPMDIQLAHRGFAQFVILSKDLNTREALRTDLLNLFENDFPNLRASVMRLENGPPVGFPVQFRVDGNDIPKIREISHQIAEIMRANPNLANVQLGWEEPSKVMKVSIDQSKARLLGVSSVDIANMLNCLLYTSRCV